MLSKDEEIRDVFGKIDLVNRPPTWKTRLPRYLFVLFAIFILHSRESELYRYVLDGKSALAWKLPFSRFMGHLSST